jgi:CheY-like chemotaxis protein
LEIAAMPKTLLLADDSVTIQKVVGITFANEDIRLITENNGDSALARARELTPDLVLADVSMPGLNGYELCAAIKADSRLAAVPVILLTGTFESYNGERTAEVGADGHIAKPFEAQALVDLVHATLERAANSKRPAAPNSPAQAFSPEAPQPVEPTPAPSPAAALAKPAAQAESSGDADFDFADFSSGSASAEVPASGDVTQFYDGSPAAAAAAAAPGEAPAETEPPTEPSGANYDETSFLDPRAALTQDAAQATPEIVPEIAPPAGSAPNLDPGTAAEFDAFGDDAQLHTPGQDRASATGETTWRLNEDTPSEPAIADSAALAAEAALDEVSDGDPGVRVVRASPDETLSDLAWAEPLEEGSAATDPMAAIEVPTPGAGAPAEPAARQPRPAVEIDSKRLHESLEKVAWEAFGPLSEQLVGEAVRKIEEIAWDVIPQIAERLIREEIAKLKGES